MEEQFLRGEDQEHHHVGGHHRGKEQHLKYKWHDVVHYHGQLGRQREQHGEEGGQWQSLGSKAHMAHGAEHPVEYRGGGFGVGSLPSLGKWASEHGEKIDG